MGNFNRLFEIRSRYPTNMIQISFMNRLNFGRFKLKERETSDFSTKRTIYTSKTPVFGTIFSIYLRTIMERPRFSLYRKAGTGTTFLTPVLGLQVKGRSQLLIIKQPCERGHPHVRFIGA